MSWQPTVGPSTADVEAMMVALRKAVADAHAAVRELNKHLKWVDDTLYAHQKKLDGDRR